MMCECALIVSLWFVVPPYPHDVARTIQFETTEWGSASPAQTPYLKGTVATSMDGSQARQWEYVVRRFRFFELERVHRSRIYTPNPATAWTNCGVPGNAIRKNGSVGSPHSLVRTFVALRNHGSIQHPVRQWGGSELRTLYGHEIHSR